MGYGRDWCGRIRRVFGVGVELSRLCGNFALIERTSVKSCAVRRSRSLQVCATPLVDVTALTRWYIRRWNERQGEAKGRISIVHDSSRFREELGTSAARFGTTTRRTGDRRRCRIRRWSNLHSEALPAEIGGAELGVGLIELGSAASRVEATLEG
jgi:hypothetical protein